VLIAELSERKFGPCLPNTLYITYLSFKILFSRLPKYVCTSTIGRDCTTLLQGNSNFSLLVDLTCKFTGHVICYVSSLCSR
jgi:hypothetical protein